MAENLIINKSDLKSEMGKPSKLQLLLFEKFQESGSVNSIASDSGLHNHTIKNLMLNNGSSRNLSRSVLVLLSTYLGLTREQVVEYRETT